MYFTSTRDTAISVPFSRAVLDALPADGGLYIPQGTEDMRRWVLYTNERTSFQSMAGALTSAFIHDEFSPIICETIATRAFTFAPEIRKLDASTYLLDLSTGPTGYHRDFGVAYLAACIETICTLQGREKPVILLDAARSGLLPCLAHCLRGAKSVRAVVVCPKGEAKGVQKDDLVQYGGNILCVQTDGTQEECHTLVDSIFQDRPFVKKMSLTVSNTTNIGRLLPQTFFYPFAFSRIKEHSSGDIYYALPPGNYSNVVAGLYSWQYALPLNGFFVPATDYLMADSMGFPLLPNSLVPLASRPPSRPSYPSNAERLENVFSVRALMIRNFIYPVALTDEAVENAAKSLFVKYGVLADRHTARAYAALVSCRNKGIANEEDGGAAVLIARDHIAFNSEYIRHTTGETVRLPPPLAALAVPCPVPLPSANTVQELKQLISGVK